MDDPNMSSCNCIGPQNGEPLCPCRMRNVEVIDGRYIEKIDHGPYVSPATEALKAYRKKILMDKVENLQNELSVIAGYLKSI